MKKVLKAVGIITAGIVGVITLSVLILMSSDNWYNYEDDYSKHYKALINNEGFNFFYFLYLHFINLC